MGWLRQLFGGLRRVEALILGILDLSGGTASALMAADRAALGPLFRRVSESTDAPPRSTLLLVYCTIASDGAILAPQAPRAPHVDCPVTIFACELAPLAFS